MDLDITQANNTDLKNTLKVYSNPSKVLNSPVDPNETTYGNENFSKNLGYYDNVRFPEYHQAVNKFATWITGSGWTAENARDQIILENISGNGKENLTSILWNGEVIMNFHGDSYAQVIRNDEETLINLKPLDPSRVDVIFKKGIIDRYEYRGANEKQEPKNFRIDEVFHRTNDRIGDSMNGQSTAENLSWSLDTMNQALEDIKRIMHRATIRVLYVDEDDKTRLAELKTSYKTAIEDGEVLILPGTKKDAEFQDLTIPPVTVYLEFIRFMEGKIYRGVGSSRAIAGDTESTNESGGKVEMVTFEPEYKRRVKDLEDDFWNQIGIKIKLNPQPSITAGVADTADANQAQTNFQPQDTATGAVQ